MRTIWDTWDYPLFEKFQAADAIVRRMTHEMGVFSVPADMYIPFLKERLGDILDQIADQNK
jgi:hypothetical protein